jgi:hypothetical protein
VTTLTCGIPGGTAAYTFFARGDLDADSTLSTFELSTGTDANGSLYHGRSMYVDNELE